MLLLFFGFLVFQLFVVFLASSKRSFFKKQLYDTSWLGPKASSHHEYNLPILFHALVLLLAIVFFHRSTFLTYLYILLFSVCSLAVCLNSPFARKYGARGVAGNKRFKKSSLFALVIFIVVIDGVAYLTLDCSNFGSLALYELLVTGAAAAVFLKGAAMLGRIRRIAPQSFFSKMGL